jgi:hypothetical protein
LTATNTPRQVAVTSPPAESAPSIVALRSPSSTTLASRCTSPSVGVGLSMRMVYSAVTVHGGRSSPRCRIRAMAAVQLQWQSSSVPMMPPLRTPGKASWCGPGRQVATSASPASKLRTCSPPGLAGPQPKQRSPGA